MLMRLLCKKMEKKETPNSPMNGDRGGEVSKTLFYEKIVKWCIIAYGNKLYSMSGLA